MDWKKKAAIQRAVARLPVGLSHPLHYWVQRRYGGLRALDPLRRFRAAADVCERLRRHGLEPRDTTILEIGTGHRINLPLAMWLIGAGSIVTVDINPYLREELVREDLRAVAADPAAVREALAPVGLDAARLDLLCEWAERDWRLDELLELCSIRYDAPADAGDLEHMASGSVDAHTSFTVLEHIAPDDLRRVMKEASRVLRTGGLAVHLVDHTDHFSHSDDAISTINFLRYSDAEWHRYAGNRYAYTNRLRTDDMQSVFVESGHRLLGVETDLDTAAVEAIASGEFPLSGQFRGRPPAVLCVKHTWIVSTPDPTLPSATTETAR